jgi:hypothetical protein
MPAVCGAVSRRGVGVARSCCPGHPSQEIREKRGLAYSTYSFGSGHAGVGTFGLYAGCAPTKVEVVEQLMHDELDRLAAGGITPGELARSIGQLSGALVLGLEDSGSRMNRLGRAELVFGELMSVEESLARIRAVTLDDVANIAADLTPGRAPWCGWDRLGNRCDNAIADSRGRARGRRPDGPGRLGRRRRCAGP